MISTIATWLAALIGGGVVVLSLGTVVSAVRSRRQDLAAADRTDRVRQALFERLRRDEPDWATWVETLSPAERNEVRSLLDRYLRTISGEERAAFLSLARALEIRREAIGTLRTGDVYDRRRALSWLAILDRRVPPRLLLEECTDHPLVREAAARVVYEHREEYPDAAALGTRLLVWDGDHVMTTTGLETLYRLNSRGSTPLLEYGETNADDWREDVLVQVLEVLGRCQITEPDDAYGWIFPLFDHHSPAVRVAAVGAFERAGWRTSVRSTLPLDTLFSDPDPRVRRATYVMVAAWGDSRAKDRLLEAAREEADTRTRLVAFRCLLELGEKERTASVFGDDPTWEWARAEARIADPGLTLDWDEHEALESAPELEAKEADTPTSADSSATETNTGGDADE